MVYICILPPFPKILYKKKKINTYIRPSLSLSIYPTGVERALLSKITPEIHRLPTNLILIRPHGTPVPRARLTHLPKPVHAAIFVHYAPVMCEDVWLAVLACSSFRAP
jgi:hypothetical protein